MGQAKSELWEYMRLDHAMDIDTSNVSSEPLYYVTPRQQPQRPQALGIQLQAATKDAEMRLAISGTCVHYRKRLRQCSICNCIMPVKVRFKKVSCPDGRW